MTPSKREALHYACKSFGLLRQYSTQPFGASTLTPITGLPGLPVILAKTHAIFAMIFSIVSPSIRILAQTV